MRTKVIIRKLQWPAADMVIIMQEAWLMCEPAKNIVNIDDQIQVWALAVISKCVQVEFYNFLNKFLLSLVLPPLTKQN